MSAGADKLRWRWPGSLAAAVISFSVLFALTYFTYGRVFEIRPLSDDNLYILSWADRAPALALGADPDLYPEWRPLAYQAIWLQYRWSNIEHPAAYYVVNLLLWAACAWIVYRIADRLTHATTAALLAAAVVITDLRPYAALSLIVERQSSMACFFGLIALLVVMTSASGRPFTRLTWVGVMLLLLASALSKEYGLAFAGAVAVYSLRERRYDVAAAAVGAVAAYAGLRIGLVGGATGRYCESMGYFFDLRDRVCYDRLDTALARQMAYNVAATGLGSLMPGFFGERGEISLAPRQLAVSALWLAGAVLGWLKGPRPMQVTALVVVFVAPLSFMAYRGHNQLAALCALAIAVGGGLAAADAAIRTRASWRWLRITGVSILLCLLMAQAIRTRRVVSDVVDDLLRRDPCEFAVKMPHLEAAFIHRIKVQYGMDNSECIPGR